MSKRVNNKKPRSVRRRDRSHHTKQRAACSTKQSIRSFHGRQKLERAYGAENYVSTSPFSMGGMSFVLPALLMKAAARGR